jgi:hypothetical protein
VAGLRKKKEIKKKQLLQKVPFSAPIRQKRCFMFESKQKKEKETFALINFN